MKVHGFASLIPISYEESTHKTLLSILQTEAYPLFFQKDDTNDVFIDKSVDESIMNQTERLTSVNFADFLEVQKLACCSLPASDLPSNLHEYDFQDDYLNPDINYIGREGADQLKFEQNHEIFEDEGKFLTSLKTDYSPSSIGLPSNITLKEGKWMYEVTIFEPGPVSVGWLVREDQNTFFASFQTQQSLFRFQDLSFSLSAKRLEFFPGDVIGCYLDADQMKFSFSLNGILIGEANLSSRYPQRLINNINLSHSMQIKDIDDQSNHNPLVDDEMQQSLKIVHESFASEFSSYSDSNLQNIKTKTIENNPIQLKRRYEFMPSVIGAGGTSIYVNGGETPHLTRMDGFRPLDRPSSHQINSLRKLNFITRSIERLLPHYYSSVIQEGKKNVGRQRMSIKQMNLPINPLNKEDVIKIAKTLLGDSKSAESFVSLLKLRKKEASNNNNNNNKRSKFGSSFARDDKNQSEFGQENIQQESNQIGRAHV